jgi:hypothetical protein
MPTQRADDTETVYPKGKQSRAAAFVKHNFTMAAVVGLCGEETLRILFKPDAHYGKSATVLKQMKIRHL